MCKSRAGFSGDGGSDERQLWQPPRTVRGACADCTPMNIREGCLKCELAKDTAVDGSASKRHDRAHQRDRDRVALLREVTET